MKTNDIFFKNPHSVAHPATQIINSINITHAFKNKKPLTIKGSEKIVVPPRIVLGSRV
jgi:hypothetical protein